MLAGMRRGPFQSQQHLRNAVSARLRRLRCPNPNIGIELSKTAPEARAKGGKRQHFPSVNACARPRARGCRKSKTVAGRQG